MRIGYFDCFSGASGDMILAACIDAGVEVGQLRADLAGLAVPGWSLEAQSIRKQGFAATQIDVKIDPTTEKPHRHLKHIREIIEKSNLPTRVAEQAVAIFTRLAEAEAAVHGTTIEKVHFHEVGAIDAIVDIVGACAALRRLGIDEVRCSPMVTGNGTVTCDHGVMPVPAPATAQLLKGVPLAACDEMGELTTPTGAAILATLSTSFGPVPSMNLSRVGIGAGRRDGQRRANVLRLLVGDVGQVGSVSAGGVGTTDELADSDATEMDEVLVLEANLDDASGQLIGHVYDALFAAGALDVYSTSIYMKKSRPAVQLTVIAPLHLRQPIEAILFAETTTFGVRSYVCTRNKLARAFETVQVRGESVRIKVGRRGGEVVTAVAEYEDCRQIATATGVPLKAIMAEAMQAWQRGQCSR